MPLLLKAKENEKKKKKKKKNIVYLVTFSNDIWKANRYILKKF